VAQTNPYQQIAARNVFCLRSPEPAPIVAPAQFLPTIRLTGITTVLGDKRAVLKIQYPGGQEQGGILREHQRIDEIEVLEIDEKAATVRVSNSGTMMALTFGSEPGGEGEPGLARRLRVGSH